MIYDMRLEVGGMTWGAQTTEAAIAYEYARGVTGATVSGPKQVELLGEWMSFLTGTDKVRTIGPMTVVKKEEGHDERKVEETDEVDAAEAGPV